MVVSDVVWRDCEGQISIADGDVHVWQLRLTADAKKIAEFFSVLSPDEQSRARRYRSLAHTTQFVVSRGGLRLILSRYLEVSPSGIKFSYGEHGKPMLARGTGPIRFSVTHSRSVVLYAIAQRQNVGVDVEYVDPGFSCREIADHFFSRVEAQELREMREEQARTAFFRLWTLKEAYLKAKGVGISQSLARPSVESWLDPNTMASVLRDDEDDCWGWTLQSFVPREGYVAAVCIQGPTKDLCFFRTSPLVSHPSEIKQADHSLTGLLEIGTGVYPVRGRDWVE